MDTKWSTITNELKEKSIRLTRQRKGILGLFLSDTHHLLTAAQIQQALLPEGHRMNLSTIYRNLETLAAAGVLRHIALNDHIARYELATDHHHHLICLHCNTTEAINLCPFKEINEFVVSQTEFVPTEHRFEIYGYCKECRQFQYQDEGKRVPVRKGGTTNDHTGH